MIICNYCPNCFVKRAVGDILFSTCILEMGRGLIRKGDMLNNMPLFRMNYGLLAEFKMKYQEYRPGIVLIWR